MRLIVAFFGFGLFFLVLLVLDLRRPAPAPPATPPAVQPMLAAPTPPPARAVVDQQPARPAEQDTPPATIAPVAVAPPPLPAPDPAPAPPAAAPADPQPAPPSGQVVWADEVRARLTRQQLRELREAAARLPEDGPPESRGQLADQFARAGQGDAQLALLAAGVRADPESIRARVEYAAALMRARLWSQAADEWRAVVNRDPSNPYGWHNLALALQEFGAIGEAIGAWDQALDLAPGNIDGRAQRGQLHLRSENWPAALTDFRAVLRVEPDAPDALLNGALAAQRVGDFAQARRWAWQVAGDGGQHPEVVTTAVQRLLRIALESGESDRPAEQLGYQLLNTAHPAEELRDLLDLLRERD